MSYESIDKMQNILSKTVFAHTDSPKKAAGRALGTIIEIISFYLIKTWGYEFSIAIERPLTEYANPGIKHNVEFTLHRGEKIKSIDTPDSKSITSNKIHSLCSLPPCFVRTANKNLIRENVLRNACTVAIAGSSFCNAYFNEDKTQIHIYELQNQPYAMIECKRVGVEEGMKKGPQTIEKAKQGSYVARTVSSIQRIRRIDGSISGVAEKDGELVLIDDYNTFIKDVISTGNRELLKNFILTIGIVSNHGNWFTSETQNKEMKILAQSYDWLLFLTDDGLSMFLHDVLLDNKSVYLPIKHAFEESYKKNKKANHFTKTNMDVEADRLLTSYFIKNISKIQGWFNVISPANEHISELKSSLKKLAESEV
ncbi:MAG: hypothetical protein FWH14_03275 [Oscillospiraceae bacterium]|nr:hypothetical protein [Oscillospiraceae bacterium]